MQFKKVGLKKVFRYIRRKSSTIIFIYNVMVDVKEFKDDPLYKALENSGFSAEDIATMVEERRCNFWKNRKGIADMKKIRKEGRTRISTMTKSTLTI